MKKKNAEISNKGEEPSVAFKAFNSFNEMEEDELKWLAGLSGEEHLHHATSLIKRVFAEQLEKHPEIDTHIYFD
ncbi:MAG: hypothetical protein WD607_03630 [Candidatus Paceibacterota bacterium]